MSTRVDGLANLSFIMGMRLCPPASTFTSSPRSARIESVSSTEVGAR